MASNTRILPGTERMSGVYLSRIHLNHPQQVAGGNHGHIELTVHSNDQQRPSHGRIGTSSR